MLLYNVRKLKLHTMPNKKITIDVFDPSSWKEAIKDTDDLMKHIERGTEIFIEKIAKVGEDAARSEFGNAIYSGTNDVEVSSSIEKIDNGYKATIRADGNAVLFIEFGTGILNPYPERMDEYITVPSAGHGEYGKGKGMNPKGWIYKGEVGNSSLYYSVKVKNGFVRTIGNPANSSMYKSRLAVEEAIDKCVKEAFYD